MQSDTIFGHLCWQAALAEGPRGAEEFLAPFLCGEPPLVLSDGFPAGLLPRPLLPRRGIAAAERRADYAARRRADKAPYVSVEDFLQFTRDTDAPVEPVEDPWQMVKTPHAAIDRRLDTTGGGDSGGRFYETESLALPDRGRLQVYLRCLAGWEERARDMLAAVSRSGFGRDKSQGCGAFAVESIEPWDAFGSHAEADAFISLSTLMPAAADPSDGRWRLRIKRGFLGEHAAGNPYKRPLVQLEPGAVFRTDAQGIRPFYGRMVRDVAPSMAAAVQFGYALPVPCRWREA